MNQAVSIAGDNIKPIIDLQGVFDVLFGAID
jgi:hypothetical protein